MIIRLYVLLIDTKNDEYIVRRLTQLWKTFHSTIASAVFLSLISGSYAFAAKQYSTNDLFHMSLEELMNVEIMTAGKAPESIKDIPASVYIVTRKDIQKYGYQTLSDIISHIPGVYNIYNYDGAPGNFGVRGFWNPNSQNSSIAILVNGIKQIAISDSDRSHPLERINVLPESIDRIEFIKGPMGVIYGNGASFGVINIITNESLNNAFSAAHGSQNTSKVSLRYANGDENRHLILNTSVYKTDGPDFPLNEMMSATGETVLTNAGVPLPAADYTTSELLEHENKYLNLSGVFDEWYFDLSYNQASVESFFLVPPVDDGDVRDVDVLTAMLGYKTKINTSLDIDTRFVFNDYLRERDFDGIIPGLVADSRIEYQNYELELLANYRATDSVSLVTGLNVFKTSDYSEFTNVPLRGIIDELVTFDRTIHAVFAQASYRANEHWLLVAGIRHEKLEGYTRTVIEQLGSPGEIVIPGDRGDTTNNTPRISAIYTIDNEQLLKFMYGTAKRISNDRFSSENIETYEINYQITKQTWFTSLSYFYNKLDNLLLDVVFLTGGGIDVSKGTQGEISTQGLEYIVRKNFSNSFDMEIGLTAQSSTDESGGANIDASYSPDLLAHVKSSYTDNNTIYSLRGRYVDSMLSFFKRTTLDPQGAYIGQESDAYMVWDFNARVNDLIPNMDLSLSIQNVFDEEIRYPNNIANNEFMDLGTIGNSRSFMLSAEYKF